MPDESVNPTKVDREQWLRLEPLVDHVLELPQEQRPAYLGEIRRRDAALAADVERLVADAEAPDPRLDNSAPEQYGYLLDEHLPTPLAPSTVLDERYVIDHEIGRGGMAIVYHASDLKFDRASVAVKVMRREGVTTLEAERFEREIRVTKRLQHPNIVPLSDKGEFADHAFFVMPRIEGETLTARLEREPSKRLSIPEALRIGIDISRALEYAHAKGVTHRDVKPSNLLLTSGVAMLADFGIAGMEVSDTEFGDTLTDTGCRVGTPAYMSPEQACGIKPDGRTDIYSLGCVLYEMIAGERPTPALRRVQAAEGSPDPVRPLRMLRADVSPRLEACIAKAIAIETADRIPNAGSFTEALERCAIEYGLSLPWWRRLYWRAPRRFAAAAVVGSIALLGTGTWLVRRARPLGDANQTAASVTLAGAAVDTSRIVVLPFDHRGTMSAASEEDDHLRDALKRWEGVDPVDRLNTREALSRRDTAHLTAPVAHDIGTALHAARYVRGEVSHEGDSATMRVGLYDTRTGVALANATAAVRRGASAAAFDALAMQLLFPSIPESTVVRLRSATHSRPALQAYARSQTAIAAWDLAAADSALTSATTYDPRFALAYLWLAQVRSWREMSPATWQFAAHRAFAARATLGPRDRRVADALAALAVHDSLRACNVWRSATTEPEGANDFAAWYGVARCDVLDFTVVRDQRSPSGWSFRSSQNHATAAFRRAFEILPAIHREFRANWFSSLKRSLHTQRTQLRWGRAQRPDTGEFAAYPSWSAGGDSIAYIPYPMRAFEEGRPEVVPTTSREAAEHQQQVFLDIATTWRTAFGPNADALLAVAVALDERGDSSAVDSVRAARRLADDAGDPASQLRTGAEEVWMLVKHSVPTDPRRLELARLIADTLLRRYANSPADSIQAIALASLAALTGRVHLAARYSREAAELVPGPVSLKPTVRALQTYAALGVPVDSIRALATRLWSAPVTASIGERARWMRRAATVAFPVYRDSAIRELARGGDFLAVAEAAWLNRDTSTIRQRLTRLRDARRLSAPEDLKLEALYPEAWLLATMGDAGAAIECITPTLDAQAKSSIENLHSVVAAGALVHGMMLRADLASRLGRRADAAKWARAVLALWAEADDEFRPYVWGMQRLAK